MGLSIFASPFATDYFLPRMGDIRKGMIYFAAIFVLTFIFSVIRAYRHCKNKKKNGYGAESGVYKGIINGVFGILTYYGVVMIPQLRAFFVLGGDSMLTDMLRSAASTITILLVNMVLIWPIWGSC